MQKEQWLTRIRQTGIVPVLRAPSKQAGMQLAEAITAGGIDILEVTMTVPGAIEIIAQLRKEHPELLVGAGTVLDPETAHACIEEGAQFVVSPALNIATIEACLKAGVLIFPGALTPTEIVTAWQAGGDVIKVFPASAMGGASYLKSIKAPFPEIQLIPTGGVSLTTAKDFLAAGAIALGVGADLCDVNALSQGRSEKITELARAYRQIVAEARSAAS
ncbi:bifunctional 4-hydroxy-2-oxoglutarate aldolase/2-dehydro-3-deoxy-phosphogluconate aldolase [Silvibacterium dinghuense]|uniref:Bifunctional 4-hydroxy-2-oxoglutarate aldolase/2-dehydro-3-deoxy-phosphogluconate aldolase n=1 Tax=Silvibacterium dinghuense TaxID=1560006 RepID=A0A4Q1S950_9BACT|nr:bifunctional 4-hydroxy-2-oxoglutarate aldolase/2-dehydro-3-deoxy-phosphogluconate aldolase [Silvibacterium dinghuense]RXS93512.1 bifunctional 4-hydroxy-2-oxoglutarate aldolase/2-dehydro-3-deoxy-phosphogluconate aldolase [Silvibacterium dinghuense]